MVSSTILAFVAIFFLWFQAPVSVFSVYPEILAGSVLLTGFFWGPRGVVVVLPVCWIILSAAWSSEDRLAIALEGHDVSLTGVVCGVPVVGVGVQRFPLLVDSSHRSPGIPARIYVSWYESTQRMRAGERWHLTLRLKRPRGASNPAGFDFERWAFMHEIGATGYVRRTVRNEQLSGTGCGLAAFRQQLADDLEAANPDGAALGHMLALAVGVRNRLEADDWNVLRRTGTAHLLAISGLHIGLAAGFAFFFMRVAGYGLLRAHIACRPLVLARVGALAGAVIYSALAGFSVPTVRAMVMTGVVILLTGLRRTIPASTVLASALYVILWTEPFAMLASGFWLSFGAVFLLLLSGFGRGLLPVESGGRIAAGLRQFWQALRAQLCLSIGLMPATGFFFGQVSLVAPLANLLVVPLFALVIIPLLILSVLILIFVPALAGPFLWLVDFLLVQVIAFLEMLEQGKIIEVIEAYKPVPVRHDYTLYLA